MALFVFLEGKMASFVSVKVYNELEKRVSDLEAWKRSVEAYAGPVPPHPDPESEIPSIEDVVEEDEPADPESEIPNIENVVEEEAPADPMNVQFGDKIAELLKDAGYGSPAEVGKAVAEGVDLTEIGGVGAATFTVIQESLGVG